MITKVFFILGRYWFLNQFRILKLDHSENFMVIITDRLKYTTTELISAQ